ncbi:hypothetical protein ACF06M_04745 [Streptomyces sp. NPDC015238]|uniref:hypothetical protein n=1 Tax=unclassified Streptomyces TaxID=2593676 RepID=UPI0036FDBC7F
MRLGPRRGSQARRFPAVLSLLLLAVTACGSGEEPQAGPPDDYLCTVSPGSPEEKLLLRVLRVGSFTFGFNHLTPDFVEGMRINLRGKPEKLVTDGLVQCSYYPNGDRGFGQATIEFRWSSPADAKKDAAVEGARSYDLTGSADVIGVSHDVSTDLYVPCRLSGEPAERSKGVHLHATTSFTVNLGEVHDHGTQDQQMDFVYRMTRRATEVLGCENKPLEKDPVVTPVAGTGTP